MTPSTTPAGDTDFWQNVAFPLPYRVLLLVGLGLLAWATNLHGLDAFELDAVGALNLKTDEYPHRLPLTQRPSGHTMAPTMIRSAYQVFFGYAGICVASWMVYVLGVNGDPERVDAYGHVPALTAILILLLLVCPFDVFFKTERDKFVHAIRRCLFSSTQTPILFSDVVLADIGTSFAKVFGDVWLSLCMILPGNTLLDTPHHEGLMRWVLPAIMSFPYAVRLRQCLIEYNLPSNESQKPLFNAIKYGTAFPVIFFSAAQGIVVVDIITEQGKQAAARPWHGEHHLFRFWLLSVFINSAYSFWWDLTNDWGLEVVRTGTAMDTDLSSNSLSKRLLQPQMRSSTALLSRRASFSAPSSASVSGSSSPTRSFFERNYPLDDIPRSLRRPFPWGLRPIYLYPALLYPILALLNLILRMSWTVKLSSHLHSARDGSVAVFWLEVAEIVRRWLWVFIRVEWELVKKMQESVPVTAERHETVLHRTYSTEITYNPLELHDAD